MGTVGKRKRVSKKRKISWRKHSKVKDVEEFIEEQDFENRIGKSIELKTDEELFQVDNKSSDDVVLSKKEKRKLLLQKPLKCFSALIHPVYLSLKEKAVEKQLPKKLLRSQKFKTKDAVKLTEIQSLHDKKVASRKKKIEKSKDKYESDVWLPETVTDKTEIVLKSEWIDNQTKQNILCGESKLRKKQPKLIRWKQTVLPAVEPPHPGMSYNPSLKDHQDLLREIAEKEQKIIKEEKHLARVTSKMFRKVTSEENESNWLEEMTQGLPEKDKIEESDDELENDDLSKISINPPVKNKKKDLKTRRKQKERQRLAHAVKLAKKEKRKISDIYKLRQIKKKLDKQEKTTEESMKKREDRKKDSIGKTKRVGSKKFVEPDLEFQEVKDLTGNLRTLKKQGNLLVDRLKSLQKRNVVEPTVIQNIRKAKVKRFVKPGHKEDWKTTVAKASSLKKVSLLKKVKTKK